MSLLGMETNTNNFSSPTKTRGGYVIKGTPAKDKLVYSGETDIQNSLGQRFKKLNPGDYFTLATWLQTPDQEDRLVHHAVGAINRGVGHRIILGAEGFARNTQVFDFMHGQTNGKAQLYVFNPTSKNTQLPFPLYKIKNGLPLDMHLKMATTRRAKEDTTHSLTTWIGSPNCTAQSRDNKECMIILRDANTYNQAHAIFATALGFSIPYAEIRNAQNNIPATPAKVTEKCFKIAPKILTKMPETATLVSSAEVDIPGTIAYLAQSSTEAHITSFTGNIKKLQHYNPKGTITYYCDKINIADENKVQQFNNLPRNISVKIYENNSNILHEKNTVMTFPNGTSLLVVGSANFLDAPHLLNAAFLQPYRNDDLPIQIQKSHVRRLGEESATLSDVMEKRKRALESAAHIISKNEPPTKKRLF